MARPPAIDVETGVRVVLNVHSLGLTDDQFLQLCSDNREFRLEMTAQGELIIMPPPGSRTGRRSSRINQRLANWADQDRMGACFNTDTGFVLPNGARRGPDAAWIRRERWDAVPEEQQEKLAPICPDFVIELRSPSNRIRDVQGKWKSTSRTAPVLAGCSILLKTAPGSTVQDGRPNGLRNPAILSGDPILPGFQLDFREIV